VFDNLIYLDLVAKQDIEGLMEKEKTYQGSWKKSGGRSAWMMVKRKIDRLTNLMSREPEPKDFVLDVEKVRYRTELINFLLRAYIAEDVFERIKYEERLSGGKGLDGGVLAEIRDLRRYLMLIESEMYAQGVIPTETVWEKDDEALHAKMEF
jgi:hypothetical protein